MQVSMHAIFLHILVESDCTDKGIYGISRYFPNFLANSQSCEGVRAPKKRPKDSHCGRRPLTAFRGTRESGTWAIRYSSTLYLVFSFFAPNFSKIFNNQFSSQIKHFPMLHPSPVHISLSSPVHTSLLIKSIH